MDRTTLCLFDIDGTLTPARKEASEEMKTFIQNLRKKVVVGVVGGSDLPKLLEQLGKNAPSEYDYMFSENGMVAFKGGDTLPSSSLVDFLGEDRVAEFINFVLVYLSTLKLPKKRGNFIEFRTGMINVSPIGRNCSYEERLEFLKFDQEHGIRARLCEVLATRFKEFDLQFSIGGQISLDVFPKGWDKRYALDLLDRTGDLKTFKTIHFFGDKTMKGGNDFEIFNDPRVQGHTVVNPDDTRAQCEKVFF